MLTGFPIFALFAVSLMHSPFAIPAGNSNCNVGPTGGSCVGNQAQTAISTQVNFVCTSGFVPCFTGQLPQYATISCQTSDKPSVSGISVTPACFIISNLCYLILNTGLECPNWPNPSATYLPSGQSFTTSGEGNSGNTQVNSSNSGSYAVLNDWTIILIGITAAACVISIAILGSGVQLEGVHIFFIMTALLIPWTILTITSGFGGSNSWFSDLDSTGQIPFGTIAYAVFSLIYFIGAVKGVSRGG